MDAGELVNDGLDIAAIAALIGDPARARILVSLMSGTAMTATELATAATVASGLYATAREFPRRHRRRRWCSTDETELPIIGCVSDWRYENAPHPHRLAETK